MSTDYLNIFRGLLHFWHNIVIVRRLVGQRNGSCRRPALWGARGGRIL